MRDDLTINSYFDGSRSFRLDLTAEQDETGWVTTRRPTPEHAAEHELADDLVHHSTGIRRYDNPWLTRRRPHLFNGVGGRAPPAAISTAFSIAERTTRASNSSSAISLAARQCRS